MATYAYTFNSGDTVTPTRLNDARTVSEIFNADIKSDAAIDGTKIAPAFGAQDITVSTANRSITNTGNFALSFGTNNTERVRILNDGNVGIGVTAAPEKLTVSGSVRGSLIKAERSNAASVTSAGFEVSIDGTSQAGIYAPAASSVAVYTGGSERMRIDGSGRVLIGKTSTAKNVNGFEIKVENNSSSIEVQKTASGAQNGLLFYHNGSYVGGLNYSDSATSLVTSSDLRLKKDIEDAGSALANVNQIRIISHGWKNADTTVRYGVIAQELFASFPEAVAKGNDGEEITKVWGADYVSLVPALVKAIQELSAKVEALEAAQ
jgi:hypothetical protein